MEVKDPALLAEMSRRVANRELEVRGQIEEVLIERTYPTGTAPNWRVVGFVPPLPEKADRAARDAISVVIGTYAHP